MAHNASGSLTSLVFPHWVRTQTGTSSWGPRSPRAPCCWGHPAVGRPCWPRLWPPRPRCPSWPWRAPSLWRSSGVRSFHLLRRDTWNTLRWLEHTHISLHLIWWPFFLRSKVCCFIALFYCLLLQGLESMKWVGAHLHLNKSKYIKKLTHMSWGRSQCWLCRAGHSLWDGPQESEWLHCWLGSHKWWGGRLLMGSFF